MLILQILLISHHVATGIFGLSTDSMSFEDSDVSTLELNLLVDKEIPLDTALQDVKSKGASHCPGCKVSHDDHHWGLPGSHCQGSSEASFQQLCCLLIWEANSALETCHNSLK